MKFLVLFSILSIWAWPLLAEEEESNKVLEYNLKDLYVIHTPVQKGDKTTEHFVEVLLTLNSYQGEPGIKAIAKGDYKYVIYLANEDLEVLRTFAFYFGGPSQFAVQISGESEIRVGKIGEYLKGTWYRAYAGLRADLSFYDRVGYRKFLQEGCLPEIGFRCQGAGEVENFFQNKSVLVLGLSLNIEGIIDDVIPTEVPTRFFVWAKAFKESE